MDNNYQKHNTDNDNDNDNDKSTSTVQCGKKNPWYSSCCESAR